LTLAFAATVCSRPIPLLFQITARPLSLTVIEDNVSDFELLCSRILKAAERDVCPDGLEEAYFQSIE